MRSKVTATPASPERNPSKRAARPARADLDLERSKLPQQPRTQPRGGCACGGGCPRCSGKTAHQGRMASAPVAPKIVHDVLRAPGRPLDPSVRASLEARVGGSLAGVRVHSDRRAGVSAAAVGARAYTVGRDIVFAEGQYRPDTPSGRRLLAHEAAHARQQTGGPLPSVIPMGEPDAAEEREAARVANGPGPVPLPVRSRPGGPVLRRQPDTPYGVRLLPDLHLTPPPPQPLLRPGDIREAYVLPAVVPAPAQIQLQPPPLLQPRQPFSLGLNQQLQAPQLPAPVTIVSVPRCVPQRALTWADFAGGPPAHSSFAAETHVNLEWPNIQGNVMMQARMNTRASWAKASAKNPTNRRATGCASLITDCQRAFVHAPPGRYWECCTPDPHCPAGIVASNQHITSSSDCASVFGPACDQAAADDSARLLRHEQGHFDIACAFANKANDALAAGSALADVQRAVNTKQAQAQRDYDHDSNHGCNATGQATWVTNIAAGLTSITIP